MAQGLPRSRTYEGIGARQARRAALRLALWYALLSALWILTSDQVLSRLELPRELEAILASTKGFLFVAVTASILYVFAVRYLGQRNAFQARYYRMFEFTGLSLMLFRVLRDKSSRQTGLVIEDANPAQLNSWGLTREQIVGRDSMQSDGLPPEASAYVRRVEQCISQGGRDNFEFHFEPTDRYYLVSVFLIEEDLWAAAARDITDLRQAEKALAAQQDSIRRAYVDVLDAVTGGKLVLMTESEIDDALGTPLSSPSEIDSPSMLGEARSSINTTVAARYGTLDRAPEVLNPVGEALNNALKYAGHGTYQVYSRDGRVQVRVSDDGPGIDFRMLPKATLVTGFSTMSTLGAGFTIMLQMSDRVMISSRPGRTTVVLEVAAPEQVQQQRTG